MNINVMYSSKSDDWATPQWLFKQLDAVYKFNLDPCASHENAKCSNYFTVDEDGLKQAWYGNVFMNPPYGRQIGKWMKKASEYKGFLVALVPAKTDTKWWHEYALKADHIMYLKGRLKFGAAKYNAPFPSALLFFNLMGANASDDN